MHAVRYELDEKDALWSWRWGVKRRKKERKSCTVIIVTQRIASFPGGVAERILLAFGDAAAAACCLHSLVILIGEGGMWFFWFSWCRLNKSSSFVRRCQRPTRTTIATLLEIPLWKEKKHVSPRGDVNTGAIQSGMARRNSFSANAAALNPAYISLLFYGNNVDPSN